MNGKSNKISQLFTVNGTGATSGIGLSLTSTIIKSVGNSTLAPTFIRIPRGMKLKIWGKSIISTQNTETVLTQMTHNGASTAPAGYVTVDTQPSATNTSTAATASVAFANKHRPIVLEGLTGKEAVRFVTTAAAASATSISYEIEITNE
jgi:hypothetical protein